MFSKLILTAILIAAAWFGFKYYMRFVAGPARREAVRRQRAEAPARSSAGGPVEDMAPCAVCGAYVPARGAARCGRPDCPF